eukprot:2801466-Rhodomonas_salina.1
MCGTRGGMPLAPPRLLFLWLLSPPSARVQSQTCRLCGAFAWAFDLDREKSECFSTFHSHPSFPFSSSLPRICLPSPGSDVLHVT